MKISTYDRFILKASCKAYSKVLGFFKGDADKAWLWMETPNPGLGGYSPLVMISLGRERKLMNWIDSQLAGNMP